RRGSVLVVGNGKRNLPESAAAFLADGLALHCSLLAGTPDGNPGALLQTALQRHPTAEVRLYQPEHSRRSDDLPFGSFPVTFVGPEKEDMRRRMVSDSNAVLVLGGATGTMRETLLALQMKKPVYVIEGYGAVAEYLLSEKGLRKKPQVIVCKDLPSAVQKIVDQLNA
ncbi:MAG TPA: hypothetical protein VN397_01700, partial [Candidatus Methylomirabilis sp.]|nr:hypothetical protein [Candidatus Methylomirabilis sp.]